MYNEHDLLERIEKHHYSNDFHHPLDLVSNVLANLANFQRDIHARLVDVRSLAAVPFIVLLTGVLSLIAGRPENPEAVRLRDELRIIGELYDKWPRGSIFSPEALAAHIAEGTGGAGPVIYIDATGIGGGWKVVRFDPPPYTALPLPTAVEGLFRGWPTSAERRWFEVGTDVRDRSGITLGDFSRTWNGLVASRIEIQTIAPPTQYPLRYDCGSAREVIVTHQEPRESYGLAKASLVYPLSDDQRAGIAELLHGQGVDQAAFSYFVRIELADTGSCREIYVPVGTERRQIRGINLLIAQLPDGDLAKLAPAPFEEAFPVLAGMPMQQWGARPWANATQFDQMLLAGQTWPWIKYSLWVPFILAAAMLLAVRSGWRLVRTVKSGTKGRERIAITFSAMRPSLAQPWFVFSWGLVVALASLPAVLLVREARLELGPAKVMHILAWAPVWALVACSVALLIGVAWLLFTLRRKHDAHSSKGTVASNLDHLDDVDQPVSLSGRLSRCRSILWLRSRV